MKKIIDIFSFLGLLLLISIVCFSASQAVTPMVITATPRPIETAVEPLPTPSSRGDSIVWQNLRVTMTQVEVTEEFINEYGSTRIPSPGQKFTWAHVQLKNIGQNEIDVPLPEHFSMLYVATEVKPIYGYRKGYPEYTDLSPVIFPGQKMDGWLRFDIPVAADLEDLRFVFLPESSGIGVSFSSPNYPYAEDHPIFVWKCAP
jgi:hypothetical protein